MLRPSRPYYNIIPENRTLTSKISRHNYLAQYAHFTPTNEDIYSKLI